jgi:polyisoprenoid-binding protein YceI
MPTTTGSRSDLGARPSAPDQKTRFELIEREVAWRLDRRRSSFELRPDGRPQGLPGQFRTVSGSVHYDEDDPTRSRIGVELELVRGADLEAGSPHRSRLGPEHRRDVAGLAMTFWTRTIDVEGPGQLRVVGEITIPGATREIELQVVQSGEGRLHFWAWTRVRPGDLGDHWADALAVLGVQTATVLDVVMGVELMGSP